MNAKDRRLLEELYGAALAAVDPARGVAAALAESRIATGLRRARSVGAFAVGKASAGMLRGATGKFERALAILPRGYPAEDLSGTEVIFASHPSPDRSSVRAARRALAFFSEFGPEDLILCLISGGASSLLCLPRPSVTLEEKRRAVDRLARSGASILELNRLRTSLSAVKGGRLGRATRATLITLVLSDVPGDRPSAVGSGPTIRRRRGDVIRLVGSNRLGLEAAGRDARRRGLRCVIVGRRLAGPARREGARFARAVVRLRPGSVLLAGGETTVNLGRRQGKGGRSLELALSAAGPMVQRRGIALLAAGSDGKDGSSRAAGAFADGTTLVRAKRLGLDAARALERHDTEPFFETLRDLFVTGPTGTNVADWAFAHRRG